MNDFVLAQGDTPQSITKDFGLPSKGNNGSTITWQSNNPSLLAISGSTADVVRTYRGQGEATVTLTATLAIGGLSKQVTLEVTVRLWDYTGSSTFYTYSTGSCQYTAAEIPSTTFVVAAPGFLNSSGSLCGAWIQLSSIHSTSTGSKATVIDVMVVDQNPSSTGPDYAFDLSSEAFAALGDPVNGILNGLDWRFIEGPDTTIKVRNANTIGSYFLSYVVTDHKYGLAKLEMHDSGSYAAWQEVPRTSGADFSLSASSVAFTPPIYFRFTDVHGTVVVGGQATDLVAGSIFDTGVQFPSGAGGGTLVDFGL